MVGLRRAGFTLIEAIVALTISSLIVVMVSSVFLVQNQFYAIQLSRTAVHDNARMMTEMVASELRAVPQGGVVVARSDSLVVRSPIVLAVVCATQAGHKVSAQFDGGESGIATSEIGGVGIQDATTGAWTLSDVSGWSAIDQPGGTPAANCAANGADTVGATSEFHDLRRLNTYFGGDPALGTVLMLYRKVTYSIRASQMDPTKMGLYRTISGGSAVEFASGLASTAKFQFRTGGSTYANTVSGASNLTKIDAIRIVADAQVSPRTGGVDDVTFGWSVNVILRNAP